MSLIFEKIPIHPLFPDTVNMFHNSIYKVKQFNDPIIERTVLVDAIIHVLKGNTFLVLDINDFHVVSWF